MYYGECENGEWYILWKGGDELSCNFQEFSKAVVSDGNEW